MKALIFANGEPNNGPMVQRALSHARVDASYRVIAADGGARIAGYFGLRIDELVGDMDSLTPEEVAMFARSGVHIHRFPPEKNQTDLELALHQAAGDGCQWIRIIGGLGGRFDQMMANVYLMALPELAACDLEMVADKQSLRVLHPGQHSISGAPDDTISLIPLKSDVTGIVTDGLQYALDHETLYFGPARGVSNVMQTAQASVSLASGLLLLVHTVGRA